MGTSTQMGRLGNVKFRFCNFSTPEDRQALLAAFQKGKSQGLTRALEKMPSSGRISLSSTLGYDLAFSAALAGGRVLRSAARPGVSTSPGQKQATLMPRGLSS